MVSAVLVWFTGRFDPTHGFLTISILVTVAFIGATIASMLYPVPQIATTEMLIGGLATALGALVATWAGRFKDKD